MALIFFDGFDTYGTNEVLYEFTSIGASTTVTIDSSGGRRGGGTLKCPTNQNQAISAPNRIITKTLPNNFTTLIFGFAFKTDVFTSNKNIVSFRDGGTLQIELGLTASGQLFVSRNGTILATSIDSISTNVWDYIEFKFTINNTTGSFEVRLNGNNILSATSQDTQNTTNAYVNEFVLGPYINSTNITLFTFFFDDLYVCDTTGSLNNDFLGDIRVDAILPTADGNYSQWTPSSAGAHYLLVDENPPNTTDYVSDGTIGNKESFVMQNPPALVSQTIHGVKTKVAVQKDDAGARSLKVGVRSGTTNGLGSAVSLGTSYKYISNIHETDPNTGVAWTASGVDNVEALVETA